MAKRLRRGRGRGVWVKQLVRLAHQPSVSHSSRMSTIRGVLFVLTALRISNQNEGESVVPDSEPLAACGGCVLGRS